MKATELNARAASASFEDRAQDAPFKSLSEIYSQTITLGGEDIDFKFVADHRMIDDLSLEDVGYLVIYEVEGDLVALSGRYDSWEGSDFFGYELYDVVSEVVETTRYRLEG